MTTGKTTLIKALLGELGHASRTCLLDVGPGPIAYAAQARIYILCLALCFCGRNRRLGGRGAGGERSNTNRVAHPPPETNQAPWVLTASVRENVVVGRPFDAERYQAVLRAACLARDLQEWPYGDQTIIGDRGVRASSVRLLGKGRKGGRPSLLSCSLDSPPPFTSHGNTWGKNNTKKANLSGGQKARIGLARMAYGDAPLYLIDDALSALDPKVGRRVFDRLICGLLSGRTRVVATHQLQYLMVRVLGVCVYVCVLVGGPRADPSLVTSALS